MDLGTTLQLVISHLKEPMVWIPIIGYPGIFAMVFAESGMLIGFFLPGDSLLFTAGLLASQGLFDIYVLAIGSFIAAVVGDSIGFYIGEKAGKKLFQKEDSLFFRKDHLLKAQSFYNKHGGKAIVLARFMPVIRAFAPVAAGMADMKYSSFVFYNILGGLIWAVGLTFAGYFLGSLIPDVDKYLLPIVGLIILASISPVLIHMAKDPKDIKALLSKIGPKR